MGVSFLCLFFKLKVLIFRGVVILLTWGAQASKIILGPFCLKYWGAQTLLLQWSEPNIEGALAPRPIVSLRHCDTIGVHFLQKEKIRKKGKKILEEILDRYCHPAAYTNLHMAVEF